MDLAQMCRAHLPTWLNLFLYVLAEAAVSISAFNLEKLRLMLDLQIIAKDIAGNMCAFLLSRGPFSSIQYSCVLL
jgi:hypothetical protein